MKTQEVQFFDPAGNPVEHIEAAREATLAAAQPPAARTSCWELFNGAVQFMVEIETIPSFFGYFIVGGTIQSGLCGVPWAVVPGGWLGNNSGAGPLGLSMHLDAVRQGPGNCPNTLTIVGQNNPAIPCFIGTYGFNGQSTTFQHHFCWLKWGSCP
jgi:hypothetical protein